MHTNIHLWLERLSSLYKNQMRQAANAEGVPLVHLEIMQYLAMCNRFSNTAQALSDYLGQTKGSISQSLKVLEKAQVVVRQPSAKDKRAFHLSLTETGQASLARMQNQFMPDISGDDEALKQILKHWQSHVGQAGFGQCRTCKYNQANKDDTYYCQLVQTELTNEDVSKLCKEHQFSI